MNFELEKVNENQVTSFYSGDSHKESRVGGKRITSISLLFCGAVMTGWMVGGWEKRNSYF